MTADDGYTIEEEPILAELAQQLRQTDEGDRSQHHPRQAPHAPDDDEREHIDGDDELEAVGVDRGQHGREESAGEPGERRAQSISEQLHVDQVDTERLRHIFIITNRGPGATQTRGLQRPGKVGGNPSRCQRHVVELDRIIDRRTTDERRRNVEDALRSSQQRLGKVGEHQHSNDLTQSEGGNGEIVTSDPSTPGRRTAPRPTST